MLPDKRVLTPICELRQTCSYSVVYTPFSITTRHTVPKAELFSWDSCLQTIENRFQHKHALILPRS